jgi:phosphomannomutase
LYLPERDAIVSALFLAELMAWHGKTLGQLLAALHAEFGEFHYGRVDLDVTRAQKEQAIAHFSSDGVAQLGAWPITRRENMDGIKLYLADFGWVLVRASGTENLLRVYSETSRREVTRQVLAVVSDLVHNLEASQ